jgi:iron(III) transport system substrate-binding protein
MNRTWRVPRPPFGVRAGSAGLLAMAVVLAAAACGSSGSSSAGGGSATGSNAGAAPAPSSSIPGVSAQLIQAAQKEGTFTFYSASNDHDNQVLLDAFQKAYGIKGTELHIGTPELVQRIESDAAANNVHADVIDLPVPTFFTQNAKDLVPVTPTFASGITQWPKSAVHPNSVEFVTLPYGVLYNSNEVQESQLPSTWSGILNSQWKSQIVLNDPNASASNMGWASAMVDAHGISFLDELQQLGPKFESSSAPATQDIASGSYKVGIPLIASQASSLVASGAPIKFKLLTDPVLAADAEVAVSKGAPHPAAGQLFFEWLISQQGVTTLCHSAPYSSPLDPTGKLGCAVSEANPKIISSNVPMARQEQIQAALKHSS